MLLHYLLQSLWIPLIYKERGVKGPIEAATSVPGNSSSIPTAADTTGQQQKHTSDLGDLSDLGEGDGRLFACSCTNHEMSTDIYSSTAPAGWLGCLGVLLEACRALVLQRVSAHSVWQPLLPAAAALHSALSVCGNIQLSRS